MSETAGDDAPTERMSVIQEARELSDQGKHTEALRTLRLVKARYADEDMNAKVAYLIELIAARQAEDPTGTLLDPLDDDDPTATRRIPRVE